MNVFMIILTILLCLGFGFLIVWNVIGIIKNLKAKKMAKDKSTENKEVK